MAILTAFIAGATVGVLGTVYGLYFASDPRREAWLEYRESARRGIPPLAHRPKRRLSEEPHMLAVARYTGA